MCVASAIYEIETLSVHRVRATLFGCFIFMIVAKVQLKCTPMYLRVVVKGIHLAEQYELISSSDCNNTQRRLNCE